MKIYFCKDINNSRCTIATEGGLAKVVEDGFDLYADNIIDTLKKYYASADLNDFNSIYSDTLVEWSIAQNDFEDVVFLYDDGAEDIDTRKFFVVDETIGGDSDERTFDSLVDANAYAEKLWDHLTAWEKGKRRIYAAWVTPEMLTEEGDWNSYHSMDFNKNCFDSNNL